MKILLAIDGSKFSKAAASSVMALAPPRSQVRVLHVVEPPSALIAREMTGYDADLSVVWREQRKTVEALAKKIAGELRSKKLEVKSQVLEGDPRSEIVDVASKWKADLIVVGSHGRKGLERFLMGSVSDAVVHHAPCSVLVVRMGRAR
ncbi:MAG TPA: universal stress protein [Candidatus Dormibacteraeota bacterium]|nr:universal stress protein [Candidatus Dormibacteraeota bacterium]